MPLDLRRILIATGVVEGALVLIFLIWSSYRGHPFPLAPNGIDWLYGSIACIPVLIVNFLLFGPQSNRIPFLHNCEKFREQVVRPLVNALGVKSGVFVSAAAGVGEELFFRGVLQSEFGIFVAALLFSVLHFGSALRSYLTIALIYALIGVYFGWLVIVSGSLWVAVIAHGVYDFLALMYLRYLFPAPPASSSGV